ncbi:SDR family oxidoreductase [Methyloversatilis thermotolerans]|uniref:SDR family oxidoreductase n=1 Tax=Methyloversatilis thermotolerans TaxID=1346290 RepID=UPI000365FC5E|nr:SDR family oxidoreductase [Methyloversatilis thermotolerans]
MKADQRILLTGATGGIGRAVARALLPRARTLLLVGRDAGKLRALRDELLAVSPDVDVRTVAADLASEAGRSAVADAADLVRDGINVLINNAGVGALAWFEEQTAQDIERIVQTNLVATMLLTHRMLPALHRQPAARVINVGSILGDIGHPGSVAYCASKFALRGFTEALRRELAGSRIRLQYLAPRATRTELNSPAQNALNAELGVASDAPEQVAVELLALLDGARPERHLGWPEKLFVRINRLLPRLVDASLAKQLAVIRRHAQQGVKP